MEGVFPVGIPSCGGDGRAGNEADQGQAQERSHSEQQLPAFKKLPK